MKQRSTPLFSAQPGWLWIYGYRILWIYILAIVSVFKEICFPPFSLDYPSLIFITLFFHQFFYNFIGHFVPIDYIWPWAKVSELMLHLGLLIFLVQRYSFKLDEQKISQF